MEQYPWFEVYRFALLELDKSKVPERVALARKKLTARLQEIPPEATTEQQAIVDALNALHAVEVSETTTRKTQDDKTALCQQELSRN